MKYLLAAVACLALASCTTQRQLTPAHPPAEASNSRPDEGPAYTPNALIEGATKPAPEPSRRLFGLLPPKAAPRSAPLSHEGGVGGGVPRKCKGCTFNVVAGNQSNSTVGKKGTAATGDGATATVIGKAKGPTAIGDSASATDNTKAGQRGGAAATAPHATATATTLKPGLPWGRIAAGVVGGGFLVWVLFFGGWGVLVAAARRKSSTTNQA